MSEKQYAELSNLVDHAKDELHRAGLFDKDSDYGGMLADAVMEIMKVFAGQGHSGFSAAMCIELFHKLSNFETLTPITSDPGEWNDVSGYSGGEKGKMWQNNRNPSMFSEDGGKTWYDVNDKDGLSARLANAIVLFPFPNEHAARLKTPASLTPFVRVRRSEGSGDGTVQGISVPKSIDVIWYIIKEDGKEVPVAQALRFPITDWTEAEARKWLKDNKVRSILFEPASKDATMASYDPSTLPDLALEAHFQCVMAETVMAGELDPEINGCMIKVVAELVKRDSTTFNPTFMRKESVALLAESLWALFGRGGEGISFPSEHASLLNSGETSIKLSTTDLKIDQLRFYRILDGDSIIGMARFEERKQVTDSLMGWDVRDFVPIRKPMQTIGLDSQERVDGEKLSNQIVWLRYADSDNPTERCAFCRFFKQPETCEIVEGPVFKDLICNWIQSQGAEADVPVYTVAEEDWIAFGVGMIVGQPDCHHVQDVAITPKGPMVMIEDSTGIPHRFSLDKKVYVERTGIEHHWTQEEADRLIAIGKARMASVDEGL